ncbi:MAG TPA: hypothetical protein VFV70_14090 [Hyphomonadaceae bacterium]|nr:hypothetical protein [Hyphomonadaceae bacterium]
MRGAVCLAVLALAIVGCREAGDVPEAPKGPAPAPAITPSLVIGCMAPFTPTTTRADLAAAFGESNVTQQTVPGPEGTQVIATVIYPNDSKRRAEVTFADAAAGTGLTGVTVDRDATEWSGPNGLKVGDPIESVERSNGGGFTVYGFDWDYGGLVADWKGGQLGSQAPNCRTVARFERTANLEDAKASGEKTHASNSKAMTAAAPRLVWFGISWSTPEAQ